MLKYYPVNLKLKDKECVVVGAGEVAQRKVRRLLECGAKVLLIAPKITPRLKALVRKKKIIFKKRRVNLKDLKGAYLIISATNDRKINALLASYCLKEDKLINVVDSPKECNFILPSVLPIGDLSIAISTNGLSPALSKEIRKQLQGRFGIEYAKLLRAMKKIRPEALKKIKTKDAKKKFFQRALQKDILGLFKAHKDKLAIRKIKSILENAAI